MIRHIAIGAAVLWASGTLGSSAMAAEPPSPAACHELDFLIGDWTATTNGMVVAKLKWEAGPGSCYLKETWNGENGSPDFVALMAYSATAHNWSYFDASPGGVRERYDYGLMYGNEFRLEEAEPSPTSHFSLFKQPDGTIRELSVRSEDGGRTWKTDYDVLWTRSGGAK